MNKKNRQKKKQKKGCNTDSPAKAEDKNDANQKIKKLDEEIDKKLNSICWYRGVCKWFNSSKGWGFLKLHSSEETDSNLNQTKPSGDIFVYQACIQKDGFRTLDAGKEVEFQV